MAVPEDQRKAATLLESVAAIPREERRLTLLSALFFFGLMASYYMVRSMRDALGAERSEELPYLFLGTFAMTVTIQPAFGWLVKRFGRRAILPSAYRALALTTLAFAGLLATQGGDALLWSQRAYFCWTSTFVLVGVSLFWGLMADVLGRERSLRLFGPIAVGGTLGAIFGSQGASWFARRAVGKGDLVEAVMFGVAAAALLEACVWLSKAVVREGGRLPGADGGERDPNAPLAGGVFSGFKRVASSGYLLGVCAYVVIYVFGSTLLYQLGAAITKTELPDTLERTAFFAQLDTWTNVVTLFFQLFAARWVLQRVGVGFALAVVPLVGVVGFTAVVFVPTLMVLAVFSVARRSAEYGISKPGRDALFTVLSVEDKYKSKLVIDSVVYRGGDAAALWLRKGLVLAGASAGALTWGLVVLAGCGVAVAGFLGARFRGLQAGDSGR